MKAITKKFQKREKFPLIVKLFLLYPNEMTCNDFPSLTVISYGGSLDLKWSILAVSSLACSAFFVAYTVVPFYLADTVVPIYVFNSVVQCISQKWIEIYCITLQCNAKVHKKFI